MIPMLGVIADDPIRRCNISKQTSLHGGPGCLYHPLQDTSVKLQKGPAISVPYRGYSTGSAPSPLSSFLVCPSSMIQECHQHHFNLHCFRCLKRPADVLKCNGDHASTRQAVISLMQAALLHLISHEARSDTFRTTSRGHQPTPNTSVHPPACHTSAAVTGGLPAGGDQGAQHHSSSPRPGVNCVGPQMLSDGVHHFMALPGLLADRVTTSSHTKPNTAQLPTTPEGGRGGHSGRCGWRSLAGSA